MHDCAIMNARLNGGVAGGAKNFRHHACEIVRTVIGCSAAAFNLLRR